MPLKCPGIVFIIVTGPLSGGRRRFENETEGTDVYHEIEGQLSIGSMIFDEEELIVGDHHYPYTEIESLEITSAPLFSTFGILTLRTDGRDITIPFARSRKNKLEAALREFERMREKGGEDLPDSAQVQKKTGTAAQAADPYEELKKLKELLDLGIVTEEEFEAKKKQLLDL